MKEHADMPGVVEAIDTFETLYRTHHADMVRLSYLITGSTHIAEEVVHDAFLAIRARWDSIRIPPAYLRRTVVNRSRSHLRRLRAEREAPVDPQPVVIPGDLDETLQLIQRLPAKRRTALVLRYYLDLSIDDIAEAMDIRPGTVKSLLHRGRETLRKQLS